MQNTEKWMFNLVLQRFCKFNCENYQQQKIMVYSDVGDSSKWEEIAAVCNFKVKTAAKRKVPAWCVCAAWETEMVIIPGGLTLILQSLDVSINMPFKDNLHHLYSEWIASINRERMQTGRVKWPFLGQIYERVATSCSPISDKLIAKSFKKTIISNLLGETEDDMWQSDGNVSTNSSYGGSGHSISSSYEDDDN
ncbi:hypothetical protein PR048_021589, partial [Dryococelus australis]